MSDIPSKIAKIITDDPDVINEGRRGMSDAEINRAFKKLDVQYDHPYISVDGISYELSEPLDFNYPEDKRVVIEIASLQSVSFEPVSGSYSGISWTAV